MTNEFYLPDTITLKNSEYCTGCVLCKYNPGIQMHECVILEAPMQHNYKRFSDCPLKPALSFDAYNANTGIIQREKMTLVIKPQPRCADCKSWTASKMSAISTMMFCNNLNKYTASNWHCADFEVKYEKS